MAYINIGWWNLENLFDAESASRAPEMKSILKHELKGWSAAVRDRKITQLARVIELMFDGEGPALLGVCEVESEAVLKRLADAINIPGRSYAVISHESHDARGIDVSFIYDSRVLSVVNTDHQVVIKRAATRDIFWARLRVISAAAEFVAVANHWPSRSAGQYASEPFRMLAGETHAYIASKMLDEKQGGEKHLPIISMGDFNDEPFNRSMQEYLLGSRDPGRVRYSRSAHMLNLMWPLMQGHDPGSYLYASNWHMLDQFLVSYGMMRGASDVRVNVESVEIFKPAIMKASSGRARKFSRPSKKKGHDPDGYSDHYPITVELMV